MIRFQLKDKFLPASEMEPCPKPSWPVTIPIQSRKALLTLNVGRTRRRTLTLPKEMV